MVKNYSETEYLDLFKNFFNTGHLEGTYKCVFLHALTDISQFGKDDLVGKEWISENDNTITLDLNFIVARFAKAYYDILGLDIKHTSLSENQPNILGIINEFQIHGFLTLAEFASLKMKGFRKKIIQRSIKPEVLRNLRNDFPLMYEHPTRTDVILFKSGLVAFMRSHRDYLRYELGKKLESHLKEKNQGRQISDFSVDPTNPFHQYLLGPRRVFLACVEQEDSTRRFRKSMKSRIDLKHLDGIDTPVYVWGLRSTSDNKEMWGRIRRGDVVLFLQNNQCFAKGIALQTIRSADEARHLWGHEDEPAHDLLIVFENVVSMHLDLVNSRIRLTKPTMPDEHNFSLIQVDEGLVFEMLSAYYDIETALDSVSGPIENNIRNVSFSLVEGKTQIRQGQTAFRVEVLKNYNKTCAVCDIRQEDLLEASHILPVGNLEFAGNIKNGICLCVLHHKMFDKRYMYFDTDYVLKFTRKATPHLQDTCTRTRITESTCNEKPSQEYLKKSSALIKCQELRDAYGEDII